MQAATFSSRQSTQKGISHCHCQSQEVCRDTNTTSRTEGLSQEPFGSTCAPMPRLGGGGGVWGDSCAFRAALYHLLCLYCILAAESGMRLTPISQPSCAFLHGFQVPLLTAVVDRWVISRRPWQTTARLWWWIPTTALHTTTGASPGTDWETSRGLWRTSLLPLLSMPAMPTSTTTAASHCANRCAEQSISVLGKASKFKSNPNML